MTQGKLIIRMMFSQISADSPEPEPESPTEVSPSPKIRLTAKRALEIDLQSEKISSGKLPHSVITTVVPNLKYVY